MGIITEEKLSKFFAEAFKEVVLPGVEDVSIRLEDVEKKLENIEENMATQKDIFRLEEKLEKVVDRQDRQGKSIENLEKRASVIAS
jgi:protein-arginine kinase activator protein McsA